MLTGGALKRVNLTYDPYGVFRGSISPAGIYARQKWLGEAGNAAWQKEYQQKTAGLFSGQAEDGSWGRSMVETVRRLFGLHLTVRSPDKAIDKALEWLIRRPVAPAGEPPLKSGDLVGLPFTVGSMSAFQWGATLFLTTIFGKAQHPRMVEGYALLGERMFRQGVRLCGWAGLSNYLRALVVHPAYAKSALTLQAVRELDRVRNPDGTWPGRLPFYQTLNALAHLDFKGAEAQLEPAFDRLARTQNKDGSWGRGQREWNTFLVVHALKNKGML